MLTRHYSSCSSYPQNTLKSRALPITVSQANFIELSNLGNSSSLIAAELGENNFDPGPIPEDIFHSGMTHFDIAYSNREGTIPAKISTMSALITLRMQGNSLTGLILIKWKIWKLYNSLIFHNKLTVVTMRPCSLRVPGYLGR